MKRILAASSVLLLVGVAACDRYDDDAPRARAAERFDSDIDLKDHDGKGDVDHARDEGVPGIDVDMKDNDGRGVPGVDVNVNDPD